MRETETGPTPDRKAGATEDPAAPAPAPDLFTAPPRPVLAAALEPNPTPTPTGGPEPSGPQQERPQGPQRQQRQEKDQTRNQQAAPARTAERADTHTGAPQDTQHEGLAQARPTRDQTDTEAKPMGINLGVPEDIEPQLKPRITVIGVGGAGGNAVNNMIDAHLEGVDFVVGNTDAQALAQARTDRRIQLGGETTHGLGSGARPDIGRAAAEESYEAISSELKGSHMCFITAGMGGGTGTGAAPVVARCARDLGILTVGVVTKPFQFEGTHRMRLADGGIDELGQYVDTLIIIPNQNLFRVANEKTTFADAFKMADNVLYAGVRSVTDLMIMPGLINLDFADVRTVMMDMGRAMMGTGEADGDNRAIEAAEAAIANPLLEETSMRGARGVLINITGGNDMTLYEVDEAANRIREEIKCEDANVIFGSCLDASLEGSMRVSVVASGIDAVAQARPRDEGEISAGASGGFGLGLVAGQRAAAAAPPAAPVAQQAAQPTPARGPARTVPGQDTVLDDTADDLRREERLNPAAAAAPAAANAEPAGAAEPFDARAQPAAPSGPDDGTRAPAARFQARPGSTPPPLGGRGPAAGRAPGAVRDVFAPPRSAEPAPAPARAPAAALGGEVSPAHQQAERGQIEPMAPVRGQTALDPRYHVRETEPRDEEAAPRRPALGQPGLRVAAESRLPAAHEAEHHGQGREDHRRERPSLFQRMTGFGRPRGAEEDGDQHGHGHGHDQDRRRVGAEPDRAVRARHDPERAGPRLGLRPDGDSGRAETADEGEAGGRAPRREDQLEIPAFLRRQAN